MVYAFVIHTLSPSVEEDISHLLYSCFFGSEDSPDAPERGDGPDPRPEIDQRTLKKEQLALVARQVQSEYSFRKSVLARDQLEPGIGLQSGIGLPEDSSQLEMGLFRLAAGDPFRTEKVAVWLGLANLGLALVCERSENRQLAESTLRLLLRHLQDYIQAVSQPAEVLTRTERVAVIIHHLLPGGRLMFMNHAVVRQLEKEMDNVLRGK